MLRARACAGEGAGGSARLRFRTSRCRWSRAMKPRKNSPRALPASVSIGCRGQNRYGNGATGSCSCGRAKPTSALGKLARPVRRGARQNRQPMARADTRSENRARRDDCRRVGRRAEPSAALAAERRLDAEAPTHFAAPTGSRVPIDYQAEGGPKIAIRVQELFGLDRHPAIAGGGKVPLLIELLSPAHRPVQTTRDLPGFWRGSYAAVRAELRGRYPKHPWPDDPIAATATRRAKPRNR